MIPVMLQIASLADAYRARRLTPVQVAEDVLARVRAYPDPAVWISRVSADEVRARARALAEDALGRDLLPLYGIPFAVKDNIDVAGMETTAACPAFAYTATRDATVVRKLLDAGALLIGKTNLDQFATGLNGTRSPYGAPRCVFDPAYVSGGSSSGSAVAVAAGLVAFSLGTDTAGSGRVPAAFNNIVGLKPTKGLIGSTGIVPACRSLDCISVFAASAGDALDVLRVVQGADAEDPFSRVSEPKRLNRAKLRFGVLAPADREFCGDGEAEGLYDAAIAALEAEGGIARPFNYAPFREAASLLYEGPFVAERLAAIEPFFTAHSDNIEPSVRAIIAGARRFSAADAFRGEYELRRLARAAVSEFDAIDMLLLPTCPTIFTVEEVRADPIRLNSQLGLYTNFVNLLDFAAIAVPAGFRATNGLPVGVTLIGPAFSDVDLAAVGDRLHRALGAGAGRTRAALEASPVTPASPDEILLVVAGAHLSGMPLNAELVQLGAHLVETTRTMPDYRLMALPGTAPPKPALVCTPGFAGPGIEVEVWAMSPPAFGQFVAAIPAPMGIGRVLLEGDRAVPGFLCEAYALEGAEDITRFGSWRRYAAARDG
ncbi:MAG: allophanate hydrolase [Acetobacteraceae bacterium]|nr:allophanate hydrolase [Acetobacteraceae bacterium]